MGHTWVPGLALPLCRRVTLGQSPSMLKSTDKEGHGEEEEGRQEEEEGREQLQPTRPLLCADEVGSVIIHFNSDGD